MRQKMGGQLQTGPEFMPRLRRCQAGRRKAPGDWCAQRLMGLIR